MSYKGIISGAGSHDIGFSIASRALSLVHNGGKICPANIDPCKSCPTIVPAGRQANLQSGSKLRDKL